MSVATTVTATPVNYTSSLALSNHMAATPGYVATGPRDVPYHSGVRRKQGGKQDAYNEALDSWIRSGLPQRPPQVMPVGQPIAPPVATSVPLTTPTASHVQPSAPITTVSAPPVHPAATLTANHVQLTPPPIQYLPAAGLSFTTDANGNVVLSPESMAAIISQAAQQAAQSAERNAIANQQHTMAEQQAMAVAEAQRQIAANHQPKTVAGKNTDTKLKENPHVKERCQQRLENVQLQLCLRVTLPSGKVYDVPFENYGVTAMRETSGGNLGWTATASQVPIVDDNGDRWGAQVGANITIIRYLGKP